MEVAGVLCFALALVAPSGGRGFYGPAATTQKGNLLCLSAIRYSEYYLYGDRGFIF